MVSFTTTTLGLMAAVGSLAAPNWYNHHGFCMSQSEAQQVADNYAELIRNYTVTLANEALAVDFVDYSESVNTLINTCPQGSAAVTLPLLAPTFSNRSQFELGQGQQQPINFKQLNLEANCKSVTLRWETTNTAPIPNPRPVVGIILILAEKAPAGNTYPWVVQTVYSEFDSGAWLQNLEQAGICAQPNASSPPIPLPSGTVGTAPPISPAASLPATTSPAVYTSSATVTSTVTDTCTDSTSTASSSAATYA